MQNWKNILLKLLWSLLGIALVVLFVLAWQAKAEKKCQGVEVELVGENTTALFMNEQEILHILQQQNCKSGVAIAQLNLTAIEKYLENTGWIKNAELYFDNQLVLQVRIEQRVPIARVFSVTGSSFYVDYEGKRLPLRQLSVLRLPVFTGFTSGQEQLSKPDSALLKHMVLLANTIREDSFFTAQIAQINIAPNGDFELIPSLGDHMVLLGSVDSLENKLDRLYTFYKKVWVPSGINAFQVLDLRFNNQVVALKKGVYPIQFNGATLFLGNGLPMADSLAPSKPAIVDSITKHLAPVIVKKDTVSKIATKVVAKPKLAVIPAKKKTNKPVKKIKPTTNNKANIKTLNNVKKTAKAVMPKSSTPKTTN
jgi:cell division protein FtsQ